MPGRGRNRAARATAPGGNMSVLENTTTTVHCDVNDLSKSVTALKLTLKPPDEAIDPGNSVFAAPKPAAVGRRQMTTIAAQANMWEIALPHDMPLFRYDVNIVAKFSNTKREKDMTRGSRSDCIYVERRETCHQVFAMIRAQKPALFGDQFAFFYDRSRILYSTKRLQLPVSGLREEVQLTPQLRAAYKIADEQLVSFAVTIKPACEDFTIVLDDFSRVLEPDLAKRDRSLQQALEIITSQVIWFGGNYVSFGNSHYALDAPTTDLGEGRFMASAFNKNVRFIEGKAGSKVAIPVLQADTKTSAFFHAGPCLNLVASIVRKNPAQLKFINEREKRTLRTQLKDLVVETTHTKRRVTIHRLSDDPANDIDIDIDGAKVPLTKYYQQKYNVRLQYPNLPCLVERTPRGNSYYPIELCNVLENQRVTIEKQTPDQQAQMIKKAAQKPSEKLACLDKELSKASVMHNQFLKQMGIEMCAKPIMFEARVLPAPTIKYGEKQVRVQSQGPGRGTWQVGANRFHKPANCASWAVVSFVGQLPLIREFVHNYYMKRATMLGMKLESPMEICELMSEASAIRSYFRYAKEGGCQFILCISPNIGGPHDVIKLMEQQIQVQTQDVRIDTVMKKVMSSNQPLERNQVLDNLLANTNMKMGGLNYFLMLDTREQSLQWLGNRRLFIGMDVNHPPPLSKDQIARGEQPREPSVVGICANTNTNPLELTGDFCYQNARREETGYVLLPAVAKILDKWTQTHDGQPPLSVVFFRDGVSEGQHKRVLEQEVPEIRKALEAIACTAKLTFVVAAKRHNTRIFAQHINPNAKPTEQNVPPGTVVDHTIVNPVSNQFYLNSHRAIQGTAKAPLYDVLVDDNEMSPDELQGIVYGLSYNHQIVNSPISLPAPVYAAHNLAKRGKNIYRAYVNSDESTSGFSSYSGASSTDAPNFDYEEITAKLSISGTDLEGHCFWA